MLMMDLRLHGDKVMMVAGPSHGGKSTFVYNLLKRRHEFFREYTNRVIWSYGIKQADLLEKLRVANFIGIEGIYPADQLRRHDILVLDDLLSESKNSKDVTNLFTRTAHHMHCFIIFITQNLFPSGKESRTRSLNTHYYAIFKNPRDQSQFEIFARQVAPRKSKALIEVFEKATQDPFQYLFIDFTQECAENYRLRGKLLQERPDIYSLK